MSKILIIFFLSLPLLFLKPHTLQNREPNNFPEYRREISRIFQKKGIDGSINLVNKAVAGGVINMDQCHILLHLIGHEAWRKYEGEFKFLSSHESNLCTASFQHGIEGQIAETEKNLSSIVSNLRDYCFALQKPLPGITCYHGAGHGSMRRYLKVHEALKICDEVVKEGPWKDPSDCYRGVFSEYANMALNYDGDSGESLKIKVKVPVNLNNPLSACDGFEEKYKESCYSQLTKILHSDDIDKSFQRCLSENREARIQAICVKILAATNSRIELFRSPFLTPPAIVYGFSQDLKSAYFKGVLDTYLGYKNNRIKKNWLGICENFKQEVDNKVCKQTFSDFAK